MDRGQKAYAGAAWGTAHSALVEADANGGLGPVPLFPRTVPSTLQLQEHAVSYGVSRSSQRRDARRSVTRASLARPSSSCRRPRACATLGESSENTVYEVDAENAFSRQPLGIREPDRVHA